METRIAGREGYSLVRVSGRIDSESYTDFGLALSGEYDRGMLAIVIDLADVSYINSAGLRELVTAAKLLRQDDGEVYLLAPSKRVMEVLEITGLVAIFTILNDEGELEDLSR